MIESEVSGVMFTGNPLTARTDEIVINASWGLGEGIVSGILTPDEYTLDGHTMAVKKSVLGTKGEADRPRPGHRHWNRRAGGTGSGAG